jgi:hypothetical protein
MSKIEHKLVPVSVTMPPDLAHELRVEAARMGISRSRFLVNVAKSALEEVNRNKLSLTSPEVALHFRRGPNE